MKHVFNSLGSNYSSAFVKLALKQLIRADAKNLQQLQQRLEAVFSGQAMFVYKGRDAIEVALRGAGIQKGDLVFAQAFACFAIEEAILRTGARPVYVDVGEHLNLTVATLEQTKKKHGVPKVLIVQHTLGIPADLQGIRGWCTTNQVLLLDDLAQAYGATDQEGALLGTQADLVIISFGRDKILDAVAGGVCIFRTQPAQAIDLAGVPTVSQLQVIKDLLYPAVTTVVTRTYAWGVGKGLHYLGKRFGFLTSPLVSPTQQTTALPPAYAALVLAQLDQLEAQLAHRRRIARVYQEALADYSVLTDELIKHGACLRFPIRLPDPNALARALTKDGFHITDRWYRAAVDCSTLKCTSVYVPGSCPRAEEEAKTILNLPTHQYVTPDDAQELSKKIIQKL